MNKTIRAIAYVLSAFILSATLAYATTLIVQQGGTGATTLTGILKGNGTAPITATALSGSAAQYLDGTGNFSTPAGGGGGSPGGLNAQIQYNNAGSFGGISGAVTDGTSVSLSGAHLLNPTINGAGAGLATLVYPNTASSATITVPSTTGTLALTSQLTSGTVTGTGTAGQVSYWNGTSSQAGSANLFFDAVNNRLGIGSSSPNSRLYVNGGDIVINNTGGVGVLRGDNSNLGSGGALLVSSSNTASSQFIQLGQALSGTGAFTPYLTVLSSGKVGIGTTSPTAKLHIAAGSATAGTAPLKLTSGTSLATTEGGAIEYDGTHLYFTAANAGTRYQLDQQTAGGTGTVTSVATDATLTGGPITTTGTLGLNLSNANNWTVGQQFRNIGIGMSSTTDIAIDAFVDGTTLTQGLRVHADASTRSAFGAYVTGDPNLRFLFTANGNLQWGNGTAGTDTNLYRTGVATLNTDGAFTVGTSISINGGTALTTTNRTGTGNLVLATSPTISNPTVSSLVITGPGAGTATISYANTGTSANLTIPSDNSGNFVIDNVTQTLTNKTLTSPVINTGVSGTAFGTGIPAFLLTPSSANLAAALTDETGTGSAVFATSPTLVTPSLGNATATSIDIALNGLKIRDTDASNVLVITTNSNLTLDRTLTITTGDANRQLTLTGNLTMSGANNLQFVTTAGTNVTLPTTGTLATLAGAETLTNKTISGSTNVLGGVTMTLGSDASFDTYYRGATGLLTRLANGTTGQVLTATTSGAPSWGAAPSPLPKALQSFDFSNSGRYSTSTTGGTVTFGNYGVTLDAVGGGTVNWGTVYATSSSVTANQNVFDGNPTATWNVTLTTVTGTHTNALTGWMVIGAPTLQTTASVTKHIGFKIIFSAGTGTLFGTQANGTTETVSTSLITGLVQNDQLELMAVVNGTTTTYYARKNGGTQVSQTATGTQPTGGDASGSRVLLSATSFSAINVGGTDELTMEIPNMSYSR